MCEAWRLSVNHSLSHSLSLNGDAVNTDGNLGPFEHFLFFSFSLSVSLALALPAVDLSVFDYASTYFIFISLASAVVVVFLFWCDIPFHLITSPADVPQHSLILILILFLNLVLSHFLFLIWSFSLCSSRHPVFPLLSFSYALLSYWCMFDVSVCIAQCCSPWSFILFLLIFMLRCFVSSSFFAAPFLFAYH